MSALRRVLLATWADADDATLEADVALILSEMRAAREEMRRARLCAEVQLAARELQRLLGESGPIEDTILVELYLAIERERRRQTMRGSASQGTDGSPTQPGTPPGTSRHASVQAAGDGPRPEHAGPRRSGVTPSAQGARSGRA